jgi:MEMO1 family protein
MAVPREPRLRSLEVFPVHERDREPFFAFRDPEGFSQTVVLPYPAAILATLMDGRRSLSQIQTDFRRQVKAVLSLADLEQFIRRLDDGYLLDSERFRAYRQDCVDEYLRAAVRPAAHAGSAYEADAQSLEEQLAGLFACREGPGALGLMPITVKRRLCGLICPHIDLHRGGPAFAWAYKRLAEDRQADLFVIFGTAHTAMDHLFCVSRKDFDTPLGAVRTDGEFIERLASRLEGRAEAGPAAHVFEDEPAHRYEHSIEFQAVFLQYVLRSRREFRIVPVLVGSFHEFIARRGQPSHSPEVAAFVSSMRATAAEYAGRICFISGADLAHIGPRFGDELPLTAERLKEQELDDQRLLEAACRGDAAEFFRHVARQKDRNRICGLAPTYTMLEVLQPARGELLKYAQAVEPDGSSCVSFASVAYYEARSEE